MLQPDEGRGKPEILVERTILPTPDAAAVVRRLVRDAFEQVSGLEPWHALTVVHELVVACIDADDGSVDLTVRLADDQVEVEILPSSAVPPPISSLAMTILDELTLDMTLDPATGRVVARLAIHPPG